MSSPDPILELLVAQARAGDQAALGRLLEFYRNYLRLVARSLIRPPLQVKLDASDLVQETFLKAHQHFGQFAGSGERACRVAEANPDSNVGQSGQTPSVCHPRPRRQESLDVLLDRSSAAIQKQLADSIPSPSAHASSREQAVLLADALARLPADYREVFILRNLEQISVEEIAVRMGRTPNAVRKLWGRAMMALQAGDGIPAMNTSRSSARDGLPANADPNSEVVRVLDRYLSGIEAGLPADTQKLLAEHPELASQLRGFLEVMQLARNIADDHPVCAPEFSHRSDHLPQFGDYRVIRQVGRGGMGIVYEAEQQSLKRRVALKVLPLAAAIDPRQLRRFQVEAKRPRSCTTPISCPCTRSAAKGACTFMRCSTSKARRWPT